MPRIKTKRIEVRASTGRYSVLCGSGILGRAASEIAKLASSSSIYIISSPKVWRAVGKKVERALGSKPRHQVQLINDAESAKNLRTVESLCRALIQSGADRKSLLLAVGGGVIGDVAGFAAATYFRGVALVHVPQPSSPRSTPPSAARLASICPKGKIW
jgi:3-dehydroquinate synthase